VLGGRVAGLGEQGGEEVLVGGLHAVLMIAGLPSCVRVFHSLHKESDGAYIER
jgi:hypothetical protein